MHRKIFGVMVLLVLALTALPTAFAQPGTDKIEPRLLDQFRTEGTAGFMIRFAEQADLSPAYSMGWEERGWFVVNTLKATAASSQASAIAYVESVGLYYESYFAGNELYVRGGNLDVALALAALPEIAAINAQRTYYVDPILAVSAPQSPDALAWGITDTGADQFWTAFGVQGDLMKVSNIDTGVQWNHPALDQAFACPGDPSNAACWADPSNICGGSACDNNGHGTHTMGTMVADDDPGLTWQAGMAPNATWIACKGCESSSCSDTALNACADWILQPGGSPANRPNVVNNSWGGSGCDLWYQGKVQAWVAAGTFPAFSAGNAGSSCSSLGSPGTYQESFASAAHDSSRNIASFSSRGPNVGSCPNTPYTKPNISSPGVSVCSTVPTNAWSCGYSGTSMASPHTAGAVALLWSCNPGLVGQIDQTFNILQDNADTPPAGNCGSSPQGGNYTYGYGYLNILAAGTAWCGDVDTGWLDGYVRDPGGNPIEGATVSAQPGFNGSAINATTDPTGYYTMSLVVGIYDVTASKMNYTSQTVQDIEILSGTVTSQDFVLTFLGAWTPNTQPNCFDWTRIDAAYFEATGRVYVMGGRSGTATDGTIYWFDPVADTCGSTSRTMPVPISNYTINQVTNGSGVDVLCTFGGRDSSGATTLAVQCYDPVANTVSQVATLPTAYTGYTPGGQAVVDNMVYVFGGFNSLSSPYELNRTDRFNPTTNTFTQVGNLSLARSYLMAAAVDGAIYAFGGTVFDGTNLNAQTRTEKMADPGGAGTWDNAAVPELSSAGAEGQAFAFQADSIYGLVSAVILAPAYAQWPGESNEAIKYDTVAASYDDSFPNLNTARRNNAGAFVTACTDDAADGLPGMWVIGGRSGSDTPPYAGPEFYPLVCANPGPPEAAFTSDSPVCLGEPMTFTDASTGNPPITEWYWEFGDGGTSVDQSPVYTYTAAGDFEVMLVVTNSSGSDWVTDTVTVYPTPTASFIYAPAVGPVPLTVFFTATVQNADPPDWYFGDGGFGTGLIVSHTYVATGTWTVLMTATSSYGCGEALATGDVTVVFEMAPVADFTADPMTGCGAPLAVQFTDTSLAVPPADAWFWDFGDTVGTSTEQNPVYTYTTTGDFVVTLWVTNTIGSDMVTDTISVYDLPVATFDYDPAAGYAPLTVYFTDTSVFGENPVWDFGDGFYGAGANVTHTYDLTGTWTVVLTVTSPFGCGDATAQADVTVYEPGSCIPVAIVSVDQTPNGCVVDFAATLTGDTPFTYAWDFGSFGAFTTSTATVDFLATGTYTGTLDVTNCDGNSSDTLDFDVTVTCELPPTYEIYLPIVVVNR